jgi:hypothetical protein
MLSKCVFPFYLLPLACLFSTLPAAARRATRTTSAFRWLDRKTDERLWARIEAAFGEELMPDDSAAMAPQLPMLSKSIFRVGLRGSSAIVLMALERDPTVYKQAFFQAYNYDVESQRKAAIHNRFVGSVWQWRLVGLARFERTAVPDIVFEFLDCVECEAQRFLAAFRYDMTEKEWRWRNWEMNTNPHVGWTLLLGSGREHGFDPEESDQTDYVYQTSCVFRLADLDGDGLDDVACWCQEKVTTMEPPNRIHSIRDTTSLFTAKGGTPRLLEITDPRAASGLRRRICSIQPQTPPCNSSDQINQTDKPR